MSVKSSEESYKLAKAIFQDISDDFYNIENNRDSYDDYTIDEILSNIKKLNRYVNKISISELRSVYEDRTINIIENNIETFLQSSYYIQKHINKIQTYDKISKEAPKLLKNVDWENIASNFEDAVSKFSRFLSEPDNYNKYKTVINNIINGTVKKKNFTEFFNMISNKLFKPKNIISKRKYPTPPEMWSDEDQKEWKKQIAQRKKGGIPDKIADFDVLGEGFISLKKYNQVNEIEMTASDGGYYSKLENDIIISQEDANFINQTIEEFKKDIINDETPILVDNTDKGEINLKIINDLQKNWYIKFENDNEEGDDYFWLSPNQNIQDVNDALDNAWQLFYDKIKK